MSAAIESLMQRWGQLSRRERRLLVTGLGVGLLTFTYLTLIEPAWMAREALHRQLPGLREQVAQADALVAEARRLTAAAAAAPRPSLQSVRLRMEESLEQAGLRASVQQIQSTDTLIDLRFRNAPFAAWLGWLEIALRETRLRVADLAITRETDAGLVAIRMVLELPGGGRP